MDQDTQLGAVSGLALRADYETWRHRAEGSDLVPESPVQQGVAAVRVPPPSRLDPAMTEVDAARTLMACYSGAVKRAFGESVMLYGRTPVQKTPIFKQLLLAVRMLREHDIAPAAWAMWSCDIWQKSPNGDGKRPPVAWLWNQKRIEERRGWFRSEAAAYETTRLFMPESAAALLASWAQFDRLLWQEYSAGGLPEATVDRLLGEALQVAPARARAEYAQRLNAAKRELETSQASLIAANKQGVWLW